jgi:hypothetical protein
MAPGPTRRAAGAIFLNGENKVMPKPSRNGAGYVGAIATGSRLNG